MKYFCISEQTANYLQKYIVIRKRKIFTGERTAQDPLEVMKKHKKEKFIFLAQTSEKMIFLILWKRMVTTFRK